MSEAIERADVFTVLPSVHQLAKSLVKAVGIVPTALLRQGEGAIVATILAGHELGLGPMAALRGITVVEGKVGMAADLMGALATRAGYGIKWIDNGDTGKVAIVELTRIATNEKHVHRFTIDEAKEADLLWKENWKKYRPAMLRARCLSAACKAFAPEALFGCYSLDEVDEIKRKPASVMVDPDRAARAGQNEEPPVDAEVIERRPEVEALLREASRLADEDGADAFFRDNRTAINGMSNDEKLALWRELRNAVERINAGRKRGSFFTSEKIKAIWNRECMTHDPETGEVNEDEGAPDAAPDLDPDDPNDPDPALRVDDGDL